MTNEEKAMIIANLNEQPYDGPDDWSYGECFRSALEMAEWKDRQLKEYLEKKKEKFYYLPKDLIGVWEKNYKLEILNEIINELFGE